MLPVWITPRLLPAKTACSANNWAPAVPAAPWRLFTSRSSTQSTPFWGDIRATPESSRPRTPFQSGQPSHRRRMTLLFPFIRRKRPPLTRNLADDLLRVTSDKQKSNGVAFGQTNRRCDPGLARCRWRRNTGASSGRRLFHKQPSGTLAAGSDQPDSNRARRALGRMQTIRDKVNDPIPRRRRRLPLPAQRTLRPTTK